MATYARNCRDALAQAVLLALWSVAGCGAGDKARVADLPTWSVVEEFRLGSVDDPETALIRVPPVYGLTIGPQGHIYIAQPVDGQIRIYDESGRFLRAVGRKGNGPGEFANLWFIGFVADTLYAINWVPGRVSFFTLEGEHLGTQALAVAPDDRFVPTGPFMLLPDGTAVVSPGNASVAQRSITHRPYLRIDRSGRIIDTLAMIPTAGEGLLFTRGRVTVSLFHPFRDYPLIAIDPRGERMAVVERRAARDTGDASFVVTEMSLRGDTLYSRRYPYRPVPVPSQLADSLVESIIGSLTSGSWTRSEAERDVREALEVPKYLPPVSDVRYAADGTLWIAREPYSTPTQLWQVHDRNGEPLAFVRLPAGIDVPLIQGDAVWAVVQDELGVPYVVRYRVQRQTR
ncbi:MAG: 6-bladed beta-propeller [Gemmatimonadota bacterium]